MLVKNRFGNWISRPWPKRGRFVKFASLGGKHGQVSAYNQAPKMNGKPSFRWAS